MKRSWKVAMAGAALTAAMATSGAFAGVANTTQKGSLLIYPRIDVRDGHDTIIRISNDNNIAVNVKCYYMNETKGRTDFEFKLTKKQAAWWSVATGEGSIGDSTGVNYFPNDVRNTTFSDPAHYNVGELLCWAVNNAGSQAINFNHLSGNATIYDYRNSNAFVYNSWNFKAYANGPIYPAVDSDKLKLDNTQYDYCPATLVGHFSPASSSLVVGDWNANTNGWNTLDIKNNTLSVVACNQDLRQDYTPHYTKLELTAWNAYEVKFTGAWECSDGYHFFDLETADAAPGVFTKKVLNTDAALLNVVGVASTRCAGSEAAGLVGVLATSVEDGSKTDGVKGGEIGTTLNAAGFKAGYIYWDPQDNTIAENAEKR